MCVTCVGDSRVKCSASAFIWIALGLYGFTCFLCSCYIFWILEAMLTRVKAVHFLNAPSFMDKLMFLIKPFIKKELMDIIQIHLAGTEALFDYIPKEAFPKEEGGNNKDFLTIRDDMFKRLEANSEFIKNENKRRVNESLRREKNRDVEEKFGGVQGSFKKLDID